MKDQKFLNLIGLTSKQILHLSKMIKILAERIDRLEDRVSNLEPGNK